jgi:SAM-dependent methyltransferase
VPDVEYAGLVAQTWDLFRGDSSGWPDRMLYLELIREAGEPVLDVGCGTGRLLLDYQALGIDIDGVDNAPEMLALCRQKAAAAGLTPMLHEQRMEALDLPRRYRTVLVPSSSFQLLTDADVARSALARIVAHLEPGGLLAMSFMTIDGPSEWSDWFVREATADDGTTVRRRSRVRGRGDLTDTEDHFEVIRDGEVISEERSERVPSTRTYSLDAVRDLYAQAGLVDVQMLHEFTREPATSETRMWTATGRRPGVGARPD